MADKLALAVGASYSVTYVITESREGTLEGVYKGMAMIGNDTALVFETDGHRTYLRASVVVLMEQTGEAPEEPERKEPAADRALYG